MKRARLRLPVLATAGWARCVFEILETHHSLGLGDDAGHLVPVRAPSPIPVSIDRNPRDVDPLGEFIVRDLHQFEVSGKLHNYCYRVGTGFVKRDFKNLLK